MKRYLLFSCSVLLLLVILFSAKQEDNNSSVDLLEAYKIASAEAIKWDDSAKPYFITLHNKTVVNKIEAVSSVNSNYIINIEKL